MLDDEDRAYIHEQIATRAIRIAQAQLESLPSRYNDRCGLGVAFTEAVRKVVRDHGQDDEVPETDTVDPLAAPLAEAAAYATPLPWGELTINQILVERQNDRAEIHRLNERLRTLTMDNSVLRDELTRVRR